jgi:hypothetical protein
MEAAPEMEHGYLGPQRRDRPGHSEAQQSRQPDPL